MTKHYCDDCGVELEGTYYTVKGLMLCRRCYQARQG